MENERIFKCQDCGEYKTKIELETWLCDFEENDLICSICYEVQMGDDL